MQNPEPLQRYRAKYTSMPNEPVPRPEKRIEQLPQQETVSSPEQNFEYAIPIRTEQQPPSSDQIPTPNDQYTTPTVPLQPQDQQAHDIETVLEDGLRDMYQRMDEATRHEFRVKGEETASKISLLLRSAKVSVRKIVSLIADWLKVIPGISKLFVEQEAKIKTDRLLDLERRKQDTQQ